MTFLQITLQDFLAFSGLFVIIIVSALYLYLFFETFYPPSFPPPIIVSDKKVTKSPVKNVKNIQTKQLLISCHPDHIPDKVKKIGLIPYLRKKHLKHGRVVTDLPLINTISVIDPMTIRSSLNIGDRPRNMYKFLEPIWGKDNLYVFSADRAKIYRSFFDPALSVDVIIDKYHDMRNFGVEIVDNWEKSIVLKHENVVRMQEQGLEFSLKATIQALFGVNLPQDFDLVAYKKAYDDVINGLFDKQFNVLSNLRDEKIQNSIKHLFQVLCILIDEKKRIIASTIQGANNTILPPRKDLLDLLVTENDPETGKKFEDEKIRNIMSLFLTCGYLTTGVAISWTIFCITQDRNVQTKIQNEIDYNLKGQLPLYHDLLNLNFLNKVIKESLRICPPIPILSRYLEKNLDLETMNDPLNLQAGTVLLYPITVIHEDIHIERDSQKFDASQPSFNQLKAPFNHCPFGFGDRICPAEKLAMVEIKLMVCLIMQRFHVELAMPLNRVSGDEKFILMARNDIYIKLIPRKGIEE
ncbi:cytochrome P450 [Rhizophagus diaphanus]|nr:cytochrome P450 [Rhizophagus diaphanus] [Rhizophagus sp. MUCL 43196]